jgi:TP901 family phage tail tape measure protein
MANFEILGVEALVLGMAAFTRDTNAINAQLTAINKATSKLASDSTIGWGVVEKSSSLAVNTLLLGAGAAAAALTSIATVALTVGESFDVSVRRAAVAVGATADQFNALEQAAIDVGKQTSVSLTDIADAENTLTRSGISVADVTGGVLQSVTLLSEASGGELGLQQSALLVSIAMNAWHLSADGARLATNALTAVANSSAIGFSTLSTAIQLVAPQAANLGLSFEDVTAALGIMGDAGIKGTIAGTALKTMLVNMEKPSATAKKLIEEYGVGLYDAEGNARNFRSVIEDMNKAFGTNAVATGKITAQQRDYALAQIFGTRSVLGAIAVADGGTAAFDKFQKSIAGTNVADMAAQFRDSLNPQIERSKNILSAFLITMSEPLTGGIDQSFGGALRGINDLLAAMDPKIPKAFGEALLTIFTGNNLIQTTKDLKDALSNNIAEPLNGLITIIVNVRNAFTQEIIPAFIILFKTISDSTGITGNFSDYLLNIASTITTVGKVIANVVINIALFVKQIKSAADTSALLTGVLKALVTLPLVGFGLTVIRVAASFLLIAGNVLILSAILYGIEQVITRIGTNWDGTLAGMVTNIRALPPELQLFLGALVLVGTYLAVNFAVGAIGFASLKLQAFIVGIENTITPIAILTASIIKLGAQAIVATAQFIIFAAQGIGNAIISITAFIANALLMAAIWVGVTAEVVASALLQAISIEGVAVAVAFVSAVITTATAIYGIAAVATVALGAAYEFLSIGIFVAIAAMLQFTGQTIAQFIISIPKILFQLGAMTLGFYATARAALAAAADIILAFVAGIVPAIISAAGAIIAAIGPILIGLAAIGIVAYALYQAWTNDFLGIQEFTKKTIQFVVDRFNELITFLKTIPFVRDLLNSVADGIKFIGDTANKYGPQVIDSMKAVFDNLINGSTDSKKALADLKAQLDAVFAAESRAANAWPSTLPGYLKGSAGNLVNPMGDYTPPVYVPPGSNQGGIVTGGTGKAASTKGAAEQLLDTIQQLIKILPGATDALAQFLAKLETDTPGRLQGMVAALLKSRDILEQINSSYVRMLILDQEIAAVQESINRIQAAQNAIDIQAKIEALGLQSQLNTLAIERLNIEAQLLPIEQQIAVIDRQIAAAQRVNYDIILQQAQLTAASLPIRQQIFDLETKINRVVDQRNQLLQRANEIRAQQSVDKLTQQLAGTQKQLDAAWKVLNVPQILALEKQKESLTNSISTAQDQLTSIQDAQKTQAQADELTQIGLKLQEVALQDILNTYDDQLTVLKNITDQHNADQAIIIAQLNIQKQKLEDIAQPLKDRLADLASEASILQNQIDLINALATKQKEQLDAQLLNAQQELGSLNSIKTSEQDRFDKLVAGFVQALVSSRAFTTSEAIEVATRLGFGDQQIAKIGAIAAAYRGDLMKAIDDTTTAINSIPKDITVHIHFQRDAIPSFATGGIVPGPVGSPQLIIAHGGEQFMGVGNSNPLFAQASTNRAVAAQSVINNYSYNVNATYEKPQAQGSIALDLRAIMAMSRK